MGAPEIPYDEKAATAAVEKSVAMGATITVIAAELGVGKTQVYDWAHEHPEFAEAIARARVSADGQVVASLFQCAVGYEYMTQVVARNGDVHTIAKKVEPSESAAVRWLATRDRDEWGSKVTDSPVLDADGEAAKRVKERSDAELVAETESILDRARARIAGGDTE